MTQPNPEKGNNAMNNDEINPTKVEALLNDAIGRLDPHDLAERIDWCKQHGVPGATMHPGTADDDGLVEFQFGGRRLALVHHDVLCGDGELDVSADFIPDDMDVEIERLTDKDE